MIELGHPKLTGAEIKEAREKLGYNMVDMMHLLGYSAPTSENPRKRLRERMEKFETGKAELPASQTRLLMLIMSFALSGAEDDPIEDLLAHGDFFYLP